MAKVDWAKRQEFLIENIQKEEEDSLQHAGAPQTTSTVRF